jgi:S-adenosylmethionine:tRNA ribosyltransferase-isomerase
MNPQNLSIRDFNYLLPENRIAKYPLPERDSSKLLIYKNGKISEDIYRNLDSHIPAHSLLIFNNTRVIEARLLFQKNTGGVIEIFCLEPADLYPDINDGMMQHGKVFWQCLIGGASKWKHGQVLEKKIKTPEKEIHLQAKYIEKKGDSFVVGFSWNDEELSFSEILHYAGIVPLPPYIKREVEKSDSERYQTIYGIHEGSVAAPTAGLHFTHGIFQKLKLKNIKIDFATLHVGAGTFKPVKTEQLKEHEMHAEFIIISRQTIQNILNNLSENIIPVGTTSLRTIESLYWSGVKLKTKQKDAFIISQWETYELEKYNIAPPEALQTLLDFMNNGKMEHLTIKTQLLIAPPYKLKVANGLITNFHQPQSTLLLLVAALTGNEWKRIYDYALQQDFRFLSYGDGCLLFTNPITPAQAT